MSFTAYAHLANCSVRKVIKSLQGRLGTGRSLGNVPAMHQPIYTSKYETQSLPGQG